MDRASGKGLGVLINRPLNAYTGVLDAVLGSLGGVQAQATARQTTQIKSALAAADPEFVGDPALSRLAIRALLATEGVSCALVGMRQMRYVEDALTELKNRSHNPTGKLPGKS